MEFIGNFNESVTMFFLFGNFEKNNFLIFRVGPASVAAVKRGEVKKSFDTAFLFAEVNADKVYWRYKGPSHPLKLVDKRTDE